jgi:hypothetical protein
VCLSMIPHFQPSSRCANPMRSTGPPVWPGNADVNLVASRTGTAISRTRPQVRANWRHEFRRPDRLRPNGTPDNIRWPSERLNPTLLRRSPFALGIALPAP